VEPRRGRPRSSQRTIGEVFGRWHTQPHPRNRRLCGAGCPLANSDRSRRRDHRASRLL